MGRSKRVTPHHSSSAAVREVVKNGMRDSAAEQKYLMDDPMRSGSDSELWVCELDVPFSLSDRSGCRDPIGEMSVDSVLHTRSVDSQVHCRLDNSGVHTVRSFTPCTPGSLTPVEGNSSQQPNSSSERSPSSCPVRTLYKRKLGLPGMELMELGQKKRQCVIKMEQGQGDSP